MKTLMFPLISVLLLLNLSGYAQSKFGNATKEELEMTSYPNDTTASALILLKEGETSFYFDDLVGDFRFQYILKVKIKILKNEGLEYCNQVIDYYVQNRENKEEIRSLSGTTYNIEDGKIIKTKLSKEYIFDEDVDNRWKIKKFTLPGAKVGSVIEYKYTIVSDFLYELRGFKFQGKDPIAYTSYEIIIPEYFKYNINMQGYEALETKKEPVNKSFHIRYKDNYGRTTSGDLDCTADKLFIKGENIPAVKKEPYVWCMNDYISQISFELQSVQMPHSMIKNYSSSWSEIDKRLFDSERFGGDLKKTGLFKDQISKDETTLGNAQSILTSIRNQVKWNEKSGFYTENLKNTLKENSGKSSDINFLLINALKAGGFDAFPVVLSTRGNGRIPIAHPSLSSFNYVITGVKIDTLTFFTDAADKYGDWNILPQKCIVNQARVLIPNGQSSWIDLSTIAAARSITSADYKFEGTKYIGKIAQAKNDIAAREFKSLYFEQHKDKDDYVDKLATKLGVEIENFEVSGENKIGENIKISYSTSKDLSLDDEFIYINPMAEPLMSENPFKDEKRIYPINFDYLNNYTQIVNIEIPKGYAIEELPKLERISTEGNTLSLIYRIGQVGNKISLNINFRINKLMFLQNDYDVLKDFFARVALKNTEQIVLKKIAE